ncbi:hypothetical protein QBC39DRAFT_413658 [Podospora conica]|nr:hypothetical protein QBC39DRAFT_413658 [Schizothecium conicum]
MTQPTICCLEDLHTRWGPPPASLDRTTINYLCHGLTLERNLSQHLGLRRRQGWKMAQQVLTEVAAVLAPSTSPSTAYPSPREPPAQHDDVQIHTPGPRAAAPNHMLTPQSMNKFRPLGGGGHEKKKDYFAYLEMLMTTTTATRAYSLRSAEGRKASMASSSDSLSSCSSTTTDDEDEDDGGASTTTDPSPPRAPTTAPTKAPRPATPTPNAAATNADEAAAAEEGDAPSTLLLERLNATWSNLLDLDLASRSVERRVARDLGALRHLRGVVLDEFLGELMVHVGGGGGSRDDGDEGHAGGHYTAAMEALGARFREGEGGRGEVMLGEWMSGGMKREVAERGVGAFDLKGVEEARVVVERELVEREVLEYENE